MIEESKEEFFPNLSSLPRPSLPPPGSGDFLTSAVASFQRESPFYNLGWLFNEEEKPDPLFNLDQYGKDSEAYRRAPMEFYGTRNLREFKTREARVMKELGWEQDMKASGMGAFFGGALGSILSPTSAIPVAGVAIKGARAASMIRNAMLIGAQSAGAASLDEFFLQQNQQLRTSDESYANIIGAAILGGVLGGAVSGLSKREVLELTERMAKEPGSTAILPLEIQGSLGAQKTPSGELIPLPEIGGISKSVPGFQALGKWLSPVADNLSMAWSKTVRALTASLDSGGLHVDGLASFGGDVASLAKQYNYRLSEAINKRNEILKKSHKWNNVLGVRRFSEEVSTALRDGGVHPDAEVQEYAQYVRKNFYEPMLREAQAVGMKGFDKLDEEYIQKYANRIAREGLATREHDKLFEILAEHFGERLTQEWSQRLERVTKLNEADIQTADDLAMSKEEVLGLRQKLEADIATLPEQFPDARQLADEIRRLRVEARTGGTKAERDALRAQAKALEEGNKERLKPFRLAENKLKQRFSRLGRSAFGRETAQAKSLRSIERLDASMEAQRDLLLRQIEKIIARVGEWGNDAFDAELEKLTDLFRESYKKWMRTSDKLAKLGYDLPDDFQSLVYSDLRRTDKASQLGLEDRFARQQAQMDEVLQELDEVRQMEPMVAREALRNMAKQIIKGHEEANAVKRQRIDKLNERIANLDPAKAAEESALYRARAKNRQNDLVKRAASKNIELVDGKFDVSRLAEEHANYFANVMMGQRASIPFFKALEERGPELARLLDIDETRVWSNGYKFEYFLERDAEYLMRAYMRTLGPDVELMRKFGTVNPMSPDAPLGKKIVAEFDEARKEAAKITDEKTRAKKLDKIAKDQERAMRNLHGIVDRIRNVRGVPPDPMDPTYRVGKFLRNLNVLRFMGKVVISSLADTAGIVMKHGLTRTFRDGFLPLVTNLKQIKMSAHEARLAGLGLDMALHGRAAAMYDIMDETRAGTRIERGVQWATNNFGFVTGMDLWNSSIKYVASSVTLPRLSEAIEARAIGTATAKQLRYLDRLGIGDPEAVKIWTQLSATGDRVEGVMFPNTGDWTDREAQRMFRGALAREVDDMIVTPGAERPLFSDGSELGRLLFQFRTFTFSAHQKLMWAGMQDLRQGDMAPVSGAMISLAMGALSYYIWGMVSGERQREEMLNASPEKWASEAVTRSFLLGAFSEVQRVGENIPGPIGDVATGGQGPTSRSAFRGPLQTLAGPSATYLIDGGSMLQGFLSGEPTNADRRALRAFMPYNNHFLFGMAFNAVEKAFAE